MIGSLAVRGAYKAIALGFRLPDLKRVSDFVQQCRTIDEVKRRRIDVVLDVGANRGFYAKHLRMMGYEGHILSFEPEPEAFEHLRQISAGDPKWRVYDFALGESSGELDFNVIKTPSGETVLSSMLEPLVGHRPEVRRVKIHRLAEVLPSLIPVADPRIFLKMDTQGYDLKVFGGVGDVDQIYLLQSEVSVTALYEDMPHYTEALKLYEDAGFRLLDLFVVNRTKDRVIVELDALMARDGVQVAP